MWAGGSGFRLQEEFPTTYTNMIRTNNLAYQIYLTVFFFLISCVNAQNKELIEKVMKELSHQKGDSAAIKFLNDKAWDVVYSDKNTCLAFVEKALELAEKSGHLYSLSDTYNTLGVYYMITSDFKRSILFHEKALEIRKKMNDRRAQMKTYNNLGSAYKYLGAYQKEMDYYFLGLKLAEEFKDTTVQMVLMNNIGDVFERQGNYDKAIECHLKALTVREKQNDIKGIVSSVINLGTINYKKKQFQISEEYFKRAEKLLTMIEDKYVTALFHSNYSALLKDLKRYPEAMDHISTSISLHNQIGNTNGNLVNFINIASILEEQKKFKEANAAYASALKLSLEVGNLQWQKQSYLGLSSTSEVLGNYKEAFINNIKYVQLKDSLTNSEIRTRIEELEKKYNTEKLQSENQLLSRTNTIQKLESEQRGYIIAFMIVVFIILSVSLFIIWKNYKFKQELSLKQIAIQAEENERQRIAKDIHDELGSGLTKIRFMSEILKSQMNTPSDAVNTISETSISLVENMRDLIWVMNPDNATLDNLISRIREYSGQYIEEFNIDFEFISPSSVPAIKISKEINRNVFMVVKEAMQNIVKHSSATKTTIEIAFDAELKITITDNGKGNASDKKERNGLLNMRSRIAQLKGEFGILSPENKGTVITLKVPLQALYY
jgi:signal transduction histidine kinase